MPTPVLTNENKSVNCSQVSLRESVTASRATLNSSRSCTPVNGITLFKDSRRGHFFRGIQIPQGPHLLLLRGNQPNHDSLLHDLTKLILDNTMQSYMSIGYGKHADIRLYPIPSERNSYEGEGMIAKVVGYNVVLKASPVTSKRGLVFLEPYDQNNDDINNKKNNENSSGNKTPNGLRSIPDSIEIYINNDLIKPSYANTFTRHQLRPGDLIFFGSQKRGYIYLFKDPRCTPDHKLELPFTSNRNLRSNYKTDKNVKNSKSDNNHTSISTSTTTTDEEDNDEITQRSTTGQQRTNSSATITLEEMKQDIKPIPTLSELEWIIEPLLIQLTLTETTFTSSTTSLTSSLTSQKLVSLDTLCTWEVTKNTILEPWRSACLLSLLIRATGLIKLRSNTSTVTTTSNNSSKNENSPLKTLRNNSMEDLLKQITSILSNYQKRAELTESNRPVFQFWLSLFFYDLAIYLTSGWLTHDIKSPSIIVDGKDIISSSSAMATPDLEHRHQDISRSELSLNHLFGELQAPEEVAEIDELRKLSYTLADQIIDKLVKTTCRAVLPYISSLYQCSPNNSPTRSQCDEMQFTSLTEWNSSRSELSRWLNQIVLCFDVAFYPSGSPSSAQNDTENLSINSTSLHSTASNKSPNGISNDEMHSQQYNYSHHHHQYLQHQQNQQTTHSRHTQKKSETSDLSMSGDSDVDNELLMGSKPLQLKKQSVADDEVFLSDHSRQNTLQSTENSSHYPIYSTMNHLEAIFWRQLLASISYEILNTILFTGTIKVDWETGMQLLNGVNWLENWLRSHKLDKHRRPLNMLMQVANLLATPRQKLFKMTWNDMRETYPSIPPALLRFLLEEYEEGYGVQNTNNWSIDEKDAAVVDEDPTDLIEIALKGWKSKERLRPAKPHHHQLPLYRPMDPYGLCTQTAMKSCINQLDGKLASNQSPCIHFRWHELMRQFPPPRVIPQIHGNRNSSINRSAIRHKLTVTNRRRLPIRTNNGRTKNKEFSPLPSKTQTSQFGSSMNTTNQTSRFPDGMKPRPSNGEPVWRGNHISEMSSDQVSGLDGNQQGFYCLKGLAASIGGIDLIGNANTDVDFPPLNKNIPIHDKWEVNLITILKKVFIIVNS
ncbi:unnamed protein product [Heterobilharzia americana]|nr:unnamed protein product [Heterobilharzia americana]